MSAGPYLYVPNSSDNTVSVIDTSTDTVVATIPVGGSGADTAAISPNGMFVYVASESGQVAVISTATNSVVAVIPVSGGDFYTVAVSPDGSLVYAANFGQSAVTVIDAQTNSVITDIPVAAFPYGIAFSPDGTRAYVASESGTVSVISTATNSVLTTVNVGNTPTMLAMNPDGSLVYVSNWGSGTVSVISTATNAVVDTITVGTYPYGVVFSPDGSRAYVATYSGAVVINTATDSVIASIDVGPSVGITVSPDGTQLYVTHYGYSPTVSVIDTATDLLVGTINVGSVPEYPAIISAPQLDHWQNNLGGNWATATNWNHGTPTATLAANIDAAGIYSVAITTNDIAYGLFINDAQATVTDYKGGALTLAGPGGATNPNGALDINAGTFVLDGGALRAGTVSISAGGTFLIANGTYTGANVLSETIIDGGSVIDNTTATVGSIMGTGTILAENKANLTITGTLGGSEVFTIANTAHALITTPVNGTGSFIIANSGVLELGGSDNENVTFASGASGTLTLDHSLTAPFTGTIFGLTPKDSIDLADLTWVSGKMKATYSGNSAGGTLTVTDGSQSVSLKLSGDYTNATWVLSKDKTGGTKVVDPPANSSPPTSDVFAYATASQTSNPPSIDHVVALFNQFTAAGFPEQQGGQITTHALSQITANEQQFLAHPHHG